MSIFSKATKAASSAAKTAAKVAQHPVSTAAAVATHPDQVVTTIVAAAGGGSKEALSFIKGTLAKAVRGDKLAKAVVGQFANAAKELLPYVPASGDIGDAARMLDVDKRARQMLDSVGPQVIAETLSRAHVGDLRQVPARAVALTKSAMPSESFLLRYGPVGAGAVATAFGGPSSGLQAYQKGQMLADSPLGAPAASLAVGKPRKAFTTLKNTDPRKAFEAAQALKGMSGR